MRPFKCGPRDAKSNLHCTSTVNVKAGRRHPTSSKFRTSGMAKFAKYKNYSTDSGMGFTDSDLDNSASDVFSPTCLDAGVKQAPIIDVSNGNDSVATATDSVTVKSAGSGYNVAPTVSVTNTKSLTNTRMPSFTLTVNDSNPKSTSSHLTKSRSADDYNPNSSMYLNDQYTTGRPRSTSDVRHTRSNLRVFQLTYHGNITLDKRVTQAMIPWIIAEKKRNNKDKVSLLLQISEKGLLGISDEKGSMLFEHRLHNVFKFTAGYNTLFAYQWKLDEDTPSSKLFILEAKQKQDIGRIQDTIKNATRNALQLDSGRYHSAHQVGRAALEDLKDNNCTMFEVLYCGRVTVSHKSAPPSLIDDAIEKFKAHEQEVQKKSLESAKKHYSCEDQLDRLSSDSKECQTTQFHSLDGLDTSGSPSSNSGSVNSVLTSDSDKDWELLPQERERAGSGASVNSRTSVNSDGPRSTRPTLRRQDTFLKLVTSRETSHNRTMVFQIGKSALTLISTDKKSFALTKKFTEISFCSQGIKNPEYFGFICREADINSTIFKCYVFKVQDEATVDTVMATLRQAFSAALQENKCSAICETCPMHIYHKLCLEVKDMTPEKALNVMRKVVETLEEKQKSSLAAFLRLERPDDQQCQNELIMTYLRSMYEQQQAIHSHEAKPLPFENVNESVQNTQPPTKIETSAPEGAFKKAKKSLASSFENLLSRSKSKTSPESKRRKPLVSFKSQLSQPPPPVISKTDAETSPMEEKRPSPEHCASTPHVSTSPLSIGSTQDRGQHVRPLSVSPLTPPTTLSLTTKNEVSTESTQNGRAASYRDDLPEQEELTPEPLQRRRSKTLGDCPSPLSPMSPPPTANAVPLSPISFTTPQTKHPVKKRKSLPPPPLKRTMSVDMGGGSPFPVTPSTRDKRRMSFRQAIFQRVVTPMSEKKKLITDISEESDVFEVEENQSNADTNQYGSEDDNTGQYQRRDAVRALWKRAIKEQILLIRMERENTKLQDRQNAVNESKMKMSYEELTPCNKEVLQKWDAILMNADDHYYLKDVIDLLKQGIPRYRAGEVWKFLRSHMERRQACMLQPCPEYEHYSDLIKHLTTHQHAILIDLGRTYPKHPYFCHPLGRGQLSLFNILKGYSLLDADVGYCQGLSFVAGFLLMHMEEQEAFDMLVFMMYGLGCRRQYKPDMVALQIQMYQLSRLLHDFHRELHDHLEANDVGPTFYAAPWFLTFFTSQFPLGFVTRVFDMLFAQGLEAIFKVALNILGNHSKRLLDCENFEELIEYIKDKLPNMTYIELENIISQSYNLDISKELQAFEVEYHVIQEEMLHSPVLMRSGSTEQEQLESANRNLRRHNEELLEQLQTARNTINSQERTIHNLQEKEVQQKRELEKLYSERSTFCATLNKLLELIPQDALTTSGIDVPNINLLTRVKSTRSNSIPAKLLFAPMENGLHRNGNNSS